MPRDRLSLAALRRRLGGLGDPARAAVASRYFKTAPGEYGAGDRFRGIAAPALHRLAREYQDLPLPLLSRLLRSPLHEDRVLALLIAVRQYNRANEAERRTIHRFYLRHRRWINNWDLVDCSAPHIVGAHLSGADRALLTRLAASPNVWDRRIAILSTFHYIRHGGYRETLAIAARLLDDEHDLIHKAVGWMLREVGKRDRAVAERFLRRHAGRMPRTMLRYAIERFPPPLRRKYMRR